MLGDVRDGLGPSRMARERGPPTLEPEPEPEQDEVYTPPCSCSPAQLLPVSLPVLAVCLAVHLAVLSYIRFFHAGLLDWTPGLRLQLLRRRRERAGSRATSERLNVLAGVGAGGPTSATAGLRPSAGAESDGDPGTFGQRGAELRGREGGRGALAKGDGLDRQERPVR